jgi:curved DNA-binding protein
MAWMNSHQSRRIESGCPGRFCQKSVTVRFAQARRIGFIQDVQFKDYYAILGVPKNASQDEIRKAFRKLARQYHPDVAKDKKAAETKFKEINEANEVLGDPEKRAKYDELGADWNQPGRQQQARSWEEMFGQSGGGFDFGGGRRNGGGGFSDFFEAFFGGGMGGGGGGRRRSATRKGEDVEFELPVTIEEALHGGKKAFAVERGGKRETITVTVPKGVRAGQRIRLTGQGEPGLGGATPGDLYLRVSIHPHGDYRVEGHDLIRPIPVPVASAVLGGEVEVPTLDGAVKLKVPAGTQPGQKFRIKGRGLPSGPGTRGDFYAEAKVMIPTSLTSNEREIWEKLR